MRRVSIAALAVCSALSSTRDLGATTCSSPATVVVPGALATAPINTHVWVYGYADAPVSYELRTAPKGKQAGRVIPTRSHRASTGTGTFVEELIPERDLPKQARLEVWAVEKEEHLVGILRTGTTRDERAPRWTGADKVAPILPRNPPKTSGRRVIVISDEDGLLVRGSRATDPDGRVLYAAWKGEPGKPIDFSRPPDGYAYETDPNETGLVLVLGSPGTCFPATFAVPDRAEIQIGLAAVDLAGNRSATSEHRVKL